jgi:voltage-gated potassium channel
MMRMQPKERIRLGPIIFTGGLISLISLAVGASLLYSVVTLATVAVGVASLYVIFPGSRFFAIAHANFLAAYACVFIFFTEAHFGTVNPLLVQVGFAVPILAFVIGAWWRRAEIRLLLESPRLRDERHFGRVFLWMIPVFPIGGATFLIAGMELNEAALNWFFFVSMGLISLIVLAVSGDVCTFLLDTGLLFEDFFHRIAGLMVPSFAFFTFYSLIVIVFGSFYRIIDRFSEAAHFFVHGQPRDLTFTESLYFSIITLSTVGYGEMVPVSSLVRGIVAVEIVCGVMLLLFGFSEIIRYSREHSRRE